MTRICLQYVMEQLEFDDFNEEIDEEIEMIQDCDEKLISATIESMSTGKLTPLLKEELRCRLQIKCFKEGKVFDVDFSEKPPVKRKLLPDEVERLERRREQNRRAAKKFRHKKRVATGRRTEILDELEKRNKELRAEIRNLIKERNCLKTLLSDHLCQQGIQLSWLEIEEIEKELGIDLSGDERNTVPGKT